MGKSFKTLVLGKSEFIGMVFTYKDGSSSELVKPHNKVKKLVEKYLNKNNQK